MNESILVVACRQRGTAGSNRGGGVLGSWLCSDGPYNGYADCSDGPDDSWVLSHLPNCTL